MFIISSNKYRLYFIFLNVLSQKNTLRFTDGLIKLIETFLYLLNINTKPYELYNAKNLMVYKNRNSEKYLRCVVSNKYT